MILIVKLFKSDLFEVYYDHRSIYRWVAISCRYTVVITVCQVPVWKQCCIICQWFHEHDSIRNEFMTNIPTWCILVLFGKVSWAFFCPSVNLRQEWSTFFSMIALCLKLSTETRGSARMLRGCASRWAPWRVVWLCLRSRWLTTPTTAFIGESLHTHISSLSNSLQVDAVCCSGTLCQSPTLAFFLFFAALAGSAPSAYLRIL